MDILSNADYKNVEKILSPSFATRRLSDQKICELKDEVRPLFIAIFSQIIHFPKLQNLTNDREYAPTEETRGRDISPASDINRQSAPTSNKIFPEPNSRPGGQKQRKNNLVLRQGAGSCSLPTEEVTRYWE